MYVCIYGCCYEYRGILLPSAHVDKPKEDEPRGRPKTKAYLKSYTHTHTIIHTYAYIHHTLHAYIAELSLTYIHSIIRSYIHTVHNHMLLYVPVFRRDIRVVYVLP